MRNLDPIKLLHRISELESANVDMQVSFDTSRSLLTLVGLFDTSRSIPELESANFDMQVYTLVSKETC